MGTHFDRRTFLTALGLSGAAVVVSCSSDDSAEPGGNASTSTTAASTTTVPVPDVALSADPFVLGVTSGDPTSSAVILWTRLIGADLPERVPLKWEVATDEAFDAVVGSGIVEADAGWAHSIHLDATDLDAATEYFFRFSVGEFVSPIGRTKTAPADDAAVDELRIAFASCQNYAHGYYSAHDAIAADRLDAIFWLGDFIYESKGNPESLRPFEGPEVKTLEEYRDRYALYLSDASLQNSRASAPWIVTWDDHEIDNNYAGMVSQDFDDAATFGARRAAAYQSFYEHQPVRLDAPTGADWPIYRTLPFGTLANFMVLDGRQYRDDQPCNDEILTSAAACEGFAEDRTMLGAEQEAWLDRELAASSSTWTVLAQQTVMSALVLGDLILNVDQWDGYPQARERLFASIRNHGVNNVVVLTGDIHAAGAATLHAGPPEAREPIAAEFVGTSITSNSLVDKFPGGEEVLAQVDFEGVEYLNASHHGYCRCTITPETWTTEFVIVDKRTEGATPSVHATAVVKAGSPLITMA